MSLTKSIKVSEETHKLLSEICPKTSTYNDIIYKLAKDYLEEEEEDLTDEEAEYCNKMIDQLEQGNYEDTYKIKTKDLTKELKKLEKQGIIWVMK